MLKTYTRSHILLTIRVSLRSVICHMKVWRANAMQMLNEVTEISIYTALTLISDVIYCNRVNLTPNFRSVCFRAIGSACYVVSVASFDSHIRF